MARPAGTKKSNKPELEILPVPPGVVAVDEWGAIYEYRKDKDGNDVQVLSRWEIPEEDQIFKAHEKTIIINFEDHFNVPNILDKFYLQYKDSYVSKLNLITHYLNDFIKYYDDDDE